MLSYRVCVCVCALCVKGKKREKFILFHHFIQTIDAKMFELFEDFILIYTGKVRLIRKSENKYFCKFI